MPVSSSTEHWIKPDALTINLNHFGDPDYLQVSVLAGAVVMAFKQDVIGYNAAHNYRTWPLEAANTYLETSSAVNVYAKLTRSEVNARALIAYDTVLRDIEGREITYAEDGSEILGEPNPDLYYVFLGQVSKSIDSSGQSKHREWTIDFKTGNLDTNQYHNEEAGGEWTKMFRLNKVTDMIDVLKTFSSAIFKKLAIKGKFIVDIKRSVDDDQEFLLNDEGENLIDEEGNPIPNPDFMQDNDETIPTTKFLKTYSDTKFLRKDKDDRSKGKISSDIGFEVGEYIEGTLGSGASIYMREGSSYSEIDYLKVRKKATFTDITVQELKHVGGEIILSPAAMVCTKVEELADGYKCFFNKEDSDGRRVYNEFRVGDQARCQTFNLAQNPNDKVGNHYYWRYVSAVGDDFIVLSKTDRDANSDIPQVGDYISQLGNRNDNQRQAAIILSAFGDDAPSYKQYNGIDGYSLEGKQVTKLSPYGNELTGKLNIEQGSTGASNLTDLPDFIDKSVQIGSVNLLLNSGFTGDYESEEMEGVMLSDNSELFSKTLKHWGGIASVKDDSEAVSGKSVEIGSISQEVETIKNEYYVISFKAKGSEIAVSCGGYHGVESLTDTYKRYEFKFQSDGSRGFLLSGTAKICDLQLERGTIATDWNPSPYDNDKTLIEFQAFKYIQDAIQNGSTDIIGGLILTSMMKLGNYKDGVLQKVNAGISGIYNDENDVAFWGGGSLEEAIKTVIKFKENPRYRPTEEEWNTMSKFAITHGGDAFYRGYIYALGGFFRGAVEIASGKIMLNDDGSGHFADKAIRWNSHGTMYRKAHEIIEWVSITDFEETKEIDLNKGYYLDLSVSDVTPSFKLPDGEYDGMLLSLRFRYKNNINRREGCAILSGNFSVRKYIDDIEQFEEANLFTIEEENKEFHLIYSELTGWTYYGDGAVINNNMLTIGKVVDVELKIVSASKFKVGEKDGLSKTISIQERYGVSTLVFDGGILTSYNYRPNEE